MLRIVTGIVLLISTLCLSAWVHGIPGSVEMPGPSLTLFNSPWYTCVRNFYVSTTGNDANNGTAPDNAHAWLTIQNADTSSRVGGDCINVAPGTYNAPVLISHGGSAPTSNGYVVYRCTVMDACHVLANGIGGNLWGFQLGGVFVVVDGFEVDGNNALQADGAADDCFATNDQSYGAGSSSTQAGGSTHHIWLLNNIIHHCALAGVALNGKEWFYTIHNQVYHNAFTNTFEGSGISYNAIQCIEAGGTNCYTSGIAGTPASDFSYTPSGNDTAAYNGTSAWTPYHNVAAWNITYNNRMNWYNNPSFANHTDGEGIIMDSFVDLFSGTLHFPYQTLVAANISYYNGNRGIHIFGADNVTIANNTAYNNVTDPGAAQPPGPACCLGDLSNAGSSNAIWVNNIAKLIPANGAPGTLYCALIAGDAGEVDVNNTYTNNSVSDSGTNSCFANNDATYWSCSNNKCATDPVFVNATPGTSEATITIFTGSITGTSLTAGTPTQGGALAVGDYISDAAVTVNAATHITAGSSSPFTVTPSQTVASETMYGAAPPTSGAFVPGNNNFALGVSSPLRSVAQYLPGLPANYGACWASLTVCPASTGGRF